MSDPRDISGDDLTDWSMWRGEECVLAQETHRSRHPGWVGRSRKTVDTAQIRLISRILANPSPSAYSIQKFSEIEKAIARQDREIAALRAQLQSQRDDLLAVSSESAKSPYQQWVESPDAEPYIGSHIAWTADHGVIAAGTSPGAVLREAMSHPHRKGMILGFVSGATL